MKHIPSCKQLKGKFHYALHIGQIIYIGKMLKENEWECLSIPRGQSARYVEKNVQHNNKKETDKK